MHTLYWIRAFQSFRFTPTCECHNPHTNTANTRHSSVTICRISCFVTASSECTVFCGMGRVNKLQTVSLLYPVLSKLCSFYTLFSPNCVPSIPCSLQTVFLLYPVLSKLCSFYTLFSPNWTHCLVPSFQGSRVSFSIVEGSAECRIGSWK